MSATIKTVLTNDEAAQLAFLKNFTVTDVRAIEAAVLAADHRHKKDAMCYQHAEALQRIATALGLVAGSDLHVDCLSAIERLKAAPPKQTVPTAKGIYAWRHGSAASLVLVDSRPSSSHPGGILKGHVIESSKFYDGCPVEQWGGSWHGPLNGDAP